MAAALCKIDCLVVRCRDADSHRKRGSLVNVKLCEQRLTGGVTLLENRAACHFGEGGVGGCCVMDRSYIVLSILYWSSVGSEAS